MFGLKIILFAIFKNRILHFIASRYVTYFIQFVNSLLIASYLGPYYLGVWGFITLILQYINQLNLGIPYSVNAIISVHYSKKRYVEKVVNASVMLLLILSIVIILFFVLSFNLNIGEKYGFHQYLPVVIITGLIAQFNLLFSNIFRVYGKLFEMAFNQTIFPVLMLMTIILFQDKNLIWALVIVNLFSFFISLIVFVLRSPIKLHLIFDKRLFRIIQIKGWYLFLYNASFYLMILSTRSFISNSYTIDEFGYFTFAFSLTNVILLLLQSFSSLIYPKLINRMAHLRDAQVAQLLDKLRNLYVITSHSLIHFAVLFYPIFLMFFSEYESTKDAFRLTALSIVLYSNAFGYSGLLISRSKDRLLSILSVISLLSNVIFAFTLVYIIKVAYSEVIIATMLSYLIFVMLLSYYGRQCLNLNNSISKLFSDIFPYNIFIPYFASILLVLLELGDLYYCIPLFLFIILNYRNYSVLKSVLKEIINKPTLINV